MNAAIVLLVLGLFFLVASGACYSLYMFYQNNPEPITAPMRGRFDPESEVEVLREIAKEGVVIAFSAQDPDVGVSMKLAWDADAADWLATFNGIQHHERNLDDACDWLRRRAVNHMGRTPLTAARINA